MQSFDYLVSWQQPETFRAQSVIGQFDLSAVKLEKRFAGAIEFPENWQIGVIVGRSGTGKTTIARNLFKASYIRGFEWTSPCFLDDFPEGLTVEDITKALNNVGFSSPPDWLKAYEQLSQGEKMRAEMARALLLKQDLIVYDEFTSVIDREIAKIACLAIQKAVRRTGKRFIAVTCHYDIVPWLEPDWVFQTDTMEQIKKKLTGQGFSLRSADAAQLYGETSGTITI